MNYEGVVIEESLQDKTILQSFKVISTKIEPVAEAHQTPWLTQWTMHTISVPADQAANVAKQLSRSIDRTHHAWYIDFKNDRTHYIIFPGKVFEIDRRRAADYQAATDFGLSLGIPNYQLDFSPHIIHWDRKQTGSL